MKIREKFREKLNSNAFTRRFLNYDFRTIALASLSLTLTAGYALYYVIFGIALGSLWYGMLALYYAMIVVMRATVVFYHGRKRCADGAKEKRSRVKIYLSSGIIICLLSLPLSLAIEQVIASKATFSRAGLTIYVAAAYTTYKAVMTVRNIVRARKSTDMTVRTARCINFADMAVSVIALQTAMFNSFSASENHDVFNAATGAGVCVFTIALGAFMIINSKREFTKIRYEEHLKNFEGAER